MYWFELAMICLQLYRSPNVATIVTFALVGTYLYKALAQQLERRDDMELIGKSQQIRYLLRESDSIAAIRQAPQRFLNAMYGQDEIRLQLLQPDGQLIMQSGSQRARYARVGQVGAGGANTTHGRNSGTCRSGVHSRSADRAVL